MGGLWDRGSHRSSSGSNSGGGGGRPPHHRSTFSVNPYGAHANMSTEANAQFAPSSGYQQSTYPPKYSDYSNQTYVPPNYSYPPTGHYSRDINTAGLAINDYPASYYYANSAYQAYAPAYPPTSYYANIYQQQAMAYNNQYANSAYGAGYGHAPGYNAQYAQQPQQYQTYQASPPQIRNPFAPPPTNDYQQQYDYEQQLAQWNSAYAPADQQDRAKKGGKGDNANLAPMGQRGAGTGAVGGADAKAKTEGADSSVTVVRKGGGETWEDKSLLEWDPTQFRIMVGNLAGEVTDESLAKAFSQYGVSKARVVRDKRTTKSRGFGFVSFVDHNQGFQAAREMVGKYIGSHPVTIKRSTTDVRPVKHKDSKNNKGKNNKNNRDKKQDKQDGHDPLRANTHAGIEKKQPSKTASGLKVIG